MKLYAVVGSYERYDVDVNDVLAIFDNYDKAMKYSNNLDKHLCQAKEKYASYNYYGYYVQDYILNE